MDDKSERIGVEAVIALQAMVGIEMTPESALVRWRGLTQQERDKTMTVARALGCCKE